jgi:hypothetical protein
VLQLNGEEDRWPSVPEERWRLAPALKRNGEWQLPAMCGRRKRRVSCGQGREECDGAMALTGERSS